MTTRDIKLAGCTPEPLMSYLKALGVLRLVSEQKDQCAKGYWQNGVFVLRSTLNEQALLDFFVNEFRPSPIVVPWSGGDYFNVARNVSTGKYKNTPTSSKVIESFLSSASPRLAGYRATIRSALDCLDACNIANKDGMKDKRAKSRFLACMRSVLSEQSVRWIDACTVLTDEKARFSAILGSGGGSDGNTHFSDNFMQNLWEILPDFDDQKAEDIKNTTGTTSLRNALFGDPSTDLVPKRTSSLFDGGAVGGQNAGQGFERVSMSNPWNIVLCLEGTLLLAGSVAKRQDTVINLRASFPFQTRLTPTSGYSTTKKEADGREIWLPLWARRASVQEIETLFSEGRAAVGRNQAVNGVDFARAASSLGVDRGIDSFVRYAIVRGRVGGDNYNTSTPLGNFTVRTRPDIDLIREMDPWIERFRRACSDTDKTPPRFRSALLRIESAIFEFCQNGGAPRFAGILCALGRAERELANGQRFREDKRLRPIPPLSSDWARASFDGSVEFELALSLTGIYEDKGKVGELRSNLEPAEAWIDGKGRAGSRWAEKDKAVVWNSAGLADNLAAVLERRVLDAGRKNCMSLPLGSSRTGSLDAVAAFIACETDDARIEELIWGLSLVRQQNLTDVARWRFDDLPPLPRAYALLKLLYLPRPLKQKSVEIDLRPEPGIDALLRSGRGTEACEVALRRLRASGLVPVTSRRNAAMSDKDWWPGDLDARRLAAALLVPISTPDVVRLFSMVIRPKKEQTQAVA